MACSLMFRTNVPDGLRTLKNSPARGRNQSTYSLGSIPPYVLDRRSAYGGEGYNQIKRIGIEIGEHL